jgi:hypothetical protein
LLFLIPFYIFTYEAELENINYSEERLSRLINEYNNIVERLEELNNVGVIDTYVMLAIKHMTKIVVRSLAVKYENVKKGVVSVMGGEVIEFEAKRIRDAALEEGRMLAKEALEEARVQGIKECVSLLKELNIAETVIIKKIMERFKISKLEVEGHLKS